MELKDKEQEEIWRNDPNNWKLKYFYFNKKDKRIFVDKLKPEYGITINFSNPKSFLVIIMSFLFFGFILYMINKKAS